MKDVLFKVCAVNTADIDAQLRQSHLHPMRRKRISALNRKEAIAASLLGDHLARELAAELCRCDPQTLMVAEGQYGRPVLQGADAEISIAHSGIYAAAAAAKRPVGIDLEKRRPVSHSIPMRLFSLEEQAWLDQARDAYLDRFFRLWTMKEAYGKMRGFGIFSSKQFYAHFVQNELLVLYPDCLFQFPGAPDGYYLSVCVEREK
jgi:phosphopantetheinyl transferase